MFCKKCGKEIQTADQFCPYCGDKIQRTAVVDDLGVLIPKNPYALCSYYLGIFAVICCILSIPAIILGVRGLQYAKEHPESRGTAHAWTGIICGSLIMLVSIWLMILMFTD